MNEIADESLCFTLVCNAFERHCRQPFCPNLVCSSFEPAVDEPHESNVMSNMYECYSGWKTLGHSAAMVCRPLWVNLLDSTLYATRSEEIANKHTDPSFSSSKARFDQLWLHANIWNASKTSRRITFQKKTIQIHTNGQIVFSGITKCVCYSWEWRVWPSG